MHRSKRHARRGWRQLAAAVGVILAANSAPAQQVDATWIGPAFGDWGQGFNWSINSVPDNGGGTTYNVLVDDNGLGNSFVSFNLSSITIDNLFITGGDTLSIDSGMLSIAGDGASSIVGNAGAILLQGALSFTAIDNSLAGGGLVQMQNLAQLTGSLGSRFTNVNNTIEGDGFIGSSIIAVTNQSAIQANNPGKILLLDPANVTDAFVNSGNLVATGGGFLHLSGAGDGSFDNSGGIIRAEAGSEVRFVSGAKIVGGELTSTGTGILRVGPTGTASFTDIIMSGNMVLQNDAEFSGTITNTGSINFPNISVLSLGAGTTTLTGGGTVNLLGLIFGPGALVNVNNHIHGVGAIANFSSMTNGAAGLIEADSGIATLTVALTTGGVLNQGTLLASNGGTLEIGGGAGPVTNIGTIAATDSSMVRLQDGVTTIGGTLTTAGNGVIRVDKTPGATLSGITNTGHVVTATVATLANTIDNRGTIDVLANARLNLGGTVTLIGGGTVQLFSSNSRIAGTGTLVNVNNLIQGQGAMTSMSPIALINQGTVAAVGGILGLNCNRVVNSGLLLATTGASLNISTDDYAGTTGALIADGTIQLAGASFAAAAVTGAGTLIVSDTSAATVAHVRTRHLTIGSGATLSVNTNGANPGVSDLVDNPEITNGRFDLNDNDLRVSAGSISTIVGQIVAARNGGMWNQPGITSTAAKNQPSHATTLGALRGSEYIGIYGANPLFGPFVVANADSLVKYTWYGDTDFNGVINFDDYNRIDSGFNAGRTGWLNGDFDYSGSINFDDYALIDLAFNVQSGTLRRAMAWLDGGETGGGGDMDEPALKIVEQHYLQFGQGYASAFISAVPEPGVIWLVGAGLPLVRRRRRSG